MKKIKTIIIILIIAVVAILLIIGYNKKKINSYPVEITRSDEPEDLIKIADNEYNKYNYERITDEKRVVYIFNDFKERELYDANYAYEALDENYSKARFNSKEDFINYINNNKIEINNSIITAYKINKEGKNTKYTIKATNAPIGISAPIIIPIR